MSEFIVIGQRAEDGIAIDFSKPAVGELVRCKDCKKVETNNCPMYRAHFGYTDDDYCSCGELKEQKDGKDTDSDSDM